jgi:hypothetical protein
MSRIIFLGLVAFVLCFPNFTLASGLVADPCVPGVDGCPVTYLEASRYGTCEFLDTAQNVYSFGIVLASIYATILLVYVGILMVMSSGNSSTLEKLKDSLINIVIGFFLIIGAFAIVTTIITILSSGDSRLVNWNQIGCIYPEVPVYKDILLGARPQDGAVVAGGTCEVMSTGGCTTDKLSCFGSNAAAASQICSVESGGVAASRSGTDLCKDGTSFSHGLYQINMVAHGGKIAGCSANMFNIRGSGTQGTCLDSKVNSGGVRYCAVRDCALKVDESQYNNCVKALQNPETNINYACQLYKDRGSNWKDWEITAGRCGLPR